MQIHPGGEEASPGQEEEGANPGQEGQEPGIRRGGGGGGRYVHTVQLYSNGFMEYAYKGDHSILHFVINKLNKVLNFFYKVPMTVYAMNFTPIFQL